MRCAVVGVIVLAAACSSGTQGPAAAPAPLQNAQAGAGKGGELTTAEAVLEASIAAQGGRERLVKLRALRQVGTFLMPQMGIKGALTTVAAPPRSMLLTVELPGLGKISQGVSGDVAWELNPITGSRVIGGEERAQPLRDPDRQDRARSGARSADVRAAAGDRGAADAGVTVASRAGGRPAAPGCR